MPITRFGLAVIIGVVASMIIFLGCLHFAYNMGKNHAFREVRHDLYFALNGSYDTYFLIPEDMQFGGELVAGRCFGPNEETLITRWLPGSQWQN